MTTDSEAVIKASYEALAFLDASDRLLWSLIEGDDPDRNMAIGSVQQLVKAAYKRVEMMHDHIETAATSEAAGARVMMADIIRLTWALMRIKARRWLRQARPRRRRVVLPMAKRTYG